MKDHLSIYNWHDLKHFGVNLLTGEADAYSLRLLCDLSREGVELLTTYLGLLPSQAAFPSNMNGRVGEVEAVASVMVARTMLPGLTVFALLHVGNYDFVLQMPTGFVGFNRGDQYDEAYLHAKLPAGWRLIHNARKTRAQDSSLDGDRNVHQFTGRVR